MVLNKQYESSRYNQFKIQRRFFISGQIFKLIKNEIELSSLEGHPKKIKELIYSKGWHNVVGFHSRNILL